MTPPNDPVAQSVHDRLLKIAKEQREDFNGVLARYGVERFLYRLTRTRHGKRFVLKGAMLFLLWLDRPHRPTRDLDLLGSGEITESTLRTIFTDVCQARVKPDGLTFDPDSITVQEIRENQVYQGLRIKVRGRLGNARVDVQIDVGIGDVITPAPVETDFPTLLDLPAPHLKTYPKETVVAEKLDAMIQLGLRNSRMKDFFDLWLMARHFEFDGPTLAESIRRTCERRQTPVTADAVCFSESYAHDPTKQVQWNAFLSRGRLTDAPRDFPQVMERIWAFLQPVVITLNDGKPYNRQWPPGGPWRR
jgi:hypothetical protein